MRCLTLLILIMRGLMDLFRRRPVWAGASAPPGTGPASARAPKLRRAPSRLASRPGGQGARRSRASGLPTGTPGSRPDGGSLPNTAHRRTRQRRQSAPVHANAFETPPCAPDADPYHHSARPGGLAPTGLCTATRNAAAASAPSSGRSALKSIWFLWPSVACRSSGSVGCGRSTEHFGWHDHGCLEIGEGPVGETVLLWRWLSLLKAVPGSMRQTGPPSALSVSRRVPARLEEM
jgi:hypothetical protein